MSVTQHSAVKNWLFIMIKSGDHLHKMIANTQCWITFNLLRNIRSIESRVLWWCYLCCQGFQQTSLSFYESSCGEAGYRRSNFCRIVSGWLLKVHKSIFVPCEELSIEAFVPTRQRRVAFCGMTNANDLHQFRVQTPSFLISDGSSEVSLKCPAVPFYAKCQTRLAKVSAMPWQKAH